MKELADFRDALTFADTDALRALEAIARQRPRLVVVESLFAATSRGTALINRIKADPLLKECEVRIFADDNSQTRTAATTAAEPAPASSATVSEHAPVQIPVAPPPPPPEPRETERQPSPRVELAPGLEILIDGTAATLVDLSIAGAEVLSPTSLKPSQRVRLQLSGPGGPIRLNGAITWAVFEMPLTGPRYRAGVEFITPDTLAIRRYIDVNRM
jgi:hypothetical protein